MSSKNGESPNEEMIVELDEQFETYDDTGQPSTLFGGCQLVAGKANIV